MIGLGLKNPKMNEREGGRRRETQIVKCKIAVTSVWRRHQRCFRSVAVKNRIEKGEGGSKKRGGRRRETQLVTSKIAVILV